MAREEKIQILRKPELLVDELDGLYVIDQQLARRSQIKAAPKILQQTHNAVLGAFRSEG